MPMYYPDLQSVVSTAKAMQRNTGDKKYTGIVPKNESELPQARIELARYFREVWKDEVAAIEIEMAVTKENYHEKIVEAIRNKIGEAIQN